MWPSGIFIREEDETKEALRYRAVPETALPASNLEGNAGKAVDLFFPLGCAAFLQADAALTLEDAGKQKTSI